MLRGLIKHLKYEGVLKTPSIIRALKRVDRKDFIPEEYKREAYGDYPIPIGFGQTIPQPHTIIFMIEHLQPEAGDKILEVGSGSGWAASILGNVVGRKGHVYGVEIVPELVVVGKQNVAKYSRGNVEIHQAADNILGMPEHAPYDKEPLAYGGFNAPYNFGLIKWGEMAEYNEGSLVVMKAKARPGYVFDYWESFLASVQGFISFFQGRFSFFQG